MKLPGGIRTTIAIALLAIVAGALAIVYLIVVPSFRQSIVSARLECRIHVVVRDRGDRLLSLPHEKT